MTERQKADRANGQPSQTNEKVLSEPTGIPGEEQILFPFARNGKRKARRSRLRETWIEAGRASVRRTQGGGLCVERHFTHLTQLPPKNLNGWTDPAPATKKPYFETFGGVGCFFRQHTGSPVPLVSTNEFGTR